MHDVFRHAEPPVCGCELEAAVDKPQQLGDAGLTVPRQSRAPHELGPEAVVAQRNRVDLLTAAAIEPRDDGSPRPAGPVEQHSAFGQPRNGDGRHPQRRANQRPAHSRGAAGRRRARRSVRHWSRCRRLAWLSMACWPRQAPAVRPLACATTPSTSWCPGRCRRQPLGIRVRSRPHLSGAAGDQAHRDVDGRRRQIGIGDSFGQPGRRRRADRLRRMIDHCDTRLQ